MLNILSKVCVECSITSRQLQCITMLTLTVVVSHSHQIKIANCSGRAGSKAEWRQCTHLDCPFGVKHLSDLLCRSCYYSHAQASCWQENGKAVTGPDLSVTLNGLTLPNPFVIGSGKGRLQAAHMLMAYDYLLCTYCDRSPWHQLCGYEESI